MVKYMGILWGFYGKYPGNGDFPQIFDIADVRYVRMGTWNPKPTLVASSELDWESLMGVKLDPFPGIIPPTMKRRFEHGQNLCEWACV